MREREIDGTVMLADKRVQVAECIEFLTDKHFPYQKEGSTPRAG